MITELLTLWRAGKQFSGAHESAAAALADGHGPLVAVRAFAAQTSNRVDDATVAVLEDGIRKGLAVLGAGIEAASWITAHADQIRGGVNAVLDAAVDLGWRATNVRATVRQWSEE